jgi:hypothetical protein
MSAPDPIRRLREIAAEAADHAILADGPVTPDADLLDLCAEALHLLSRADKVHANYHATPAYGLGGTPATRAEREALWGEAGFLHREARPLMRRLSKTAAKTPAGIYAKALVVKGSVTGAASLAKSLAEDLIACRELRESLWPADAETRGPAI